MREIKFRAIPKEDFIGKETMLGTISYYTQETGYDGTFVYGYLADGYIIGDTIEASEDYYYPVYWIPIKEETIGQYTGLKDRTGTEIYEGDILELINEADRRVKAICKFGKRRIMHGGNTIEIQGFYFEVEGRKTNPVVCNYKGLHDLEIMEVRGNIYENPELLEG